MNRAFAAGIAVAQPANAQFVRVVASNSLKELSEEVGQPLLVLRCQSADQRRHEPLALGQYSTARCLARGCEKEFDGAPVDLRGLTLDEPIGNQAVDQADATCLRETQQTAECIVRKPRLMAKHDERCGAFAGSACPSLHCCLEFVKKAEHGGTEQICGAEFI